MLHFDMKFIYYPILAVLLMFPLQGYCDPVDPVSATETTRSNQGQDGSFEAMLIPIFEDQLTEFDKPSDDGPKLSMISQASCEDIIAIKIVFKGMDITNDNIADVTYDIKVITPDGMIYDGSDHKDLSAYQGRVINPENIYNNQDLLKLEFELEDEVGAYIIETVVKDNIGAKQVTLKKQIKFMGCGQS